MWMKLKMKSLGLRRPFHHYCDDDTAKAVITRELQTSHKLYGYRSMYVETYASQVQIKLCTFMTC